MSSRRRFLAALACAALPLPALGRRPALRVHELAGEVTLNGYPFTRSSALLPGHTLQTGAGAHLVFTLGGDAFFLRPNTTLRLESSAGDDAVDLLRLRSGALGAAFSPGARRTIVATTASIAVHGTGLYLEATPAWTYACTCFGAAELRNPLREATLEAIAATSEHHVARRVLGDPLRGLRVAHAGRERHTSEEMAALEALAGRTSPLRG